MRFQEGQLIGGRYRVEKYIGSGSGAEVFKVRDDQRSAVLALKILRSDLSFNPDFVRRFHDEVSALARLQHPNIVRFYEFNQNNGLFYFVMDFIEGTNLRQKLKLSTSSLRIEEILSILRPVCAALHYAHGQGIIHCDIKPENILIDETGNILLTDFGIASITGAESNIPGGIGTPAYMAPEQIQNDILLPQTDIYALGIMLYELLTGYKPFSGKNADSRLDLNERIRWEQINILPPPPSRLNGTLSPSINAVISKCLQKDPNNRYADASDLLLAIESLGSQSVLSPNDKTKIPLPDATKETGIRKSPIKRPNPVVAIGVAFLAIIIIGILAFRGNSLNGLQRTPQLEVVEPQTYKYSSACMIIAISLQPKTDLYECITSISIQPDNKVQVNFEWKVASLSNLTGVNVQPDSENHNMYLIDNLGNRLDHITTGGETNQEMELYNGQTKQGWFMFPALNPDATYFYFVDEDNNVRSPRLDRQW